MRRRGKFYRINQYIPAEKVRVVSSEGNNVGILTKEEALKRAQKQGLDLVEIAPKVNPPVCKIIDFKKFRYEQGKKQKKSQKKSLRTELKEIRLKPFMAEYDFQRRVEQAKKFLKKGERVKFRLLFKGREINKKDFGFKLFEKAKELLKEVGVVSQEPKLKGKILEMVLKPNIK